MEKGHTLKQSLWRQTQTEEFNQTFPFSESSHIRFSEIDFAFSLRPRTNIRFMCEKSDTFRV